jgi:hypothetical protein
VQGETFRVGGRIQNDPFGQAGGVGLGNLAGIMSSDDCGETAAGLHQVCLDLGKMSVRGAVLGGCDGFSCFVS